MPGEHEPIRLAIADDALREAVEVALAASASVHTIPPATTPVTVTSDALRPGQAARFRVNPDGTLEIAVDPTQTTMAGLDFLHEVGHYVDWAVLPPPVQMSSAALSAEFGDWLTAVGNSDACRELLRIATRPATFVVVLDDGTAVEVFEDPNHAAYTLTAPEVLARSYCQFIATESGHPVLTEELGRALENHYPEQWRPDEFEPIARAVAGLLGGVIP